jgi:hypothetical protein
LIGVHWLLLCAGLLPMLCAPALSADELYSVDAVKAAFLMRLTGYVQWPAQNPPALPFTIAVLGADGLAAQLQMLLRERHVRDSPAEVRQIRSIQELGNAQVVYLGSDIDLKLRRMIEAVADRPVLVVTDSEHGMELGSAVTFLVVDHRVRFEISLPAAERAGLSIGSELLAVALRVQTGNQRPGPDCGQPQTEEIRANCAARGALAGN